MVAAGSAGAVGPGSWLYRHAQGEGQQLSEDGASACPLCSQIRGEAWGRLLVLGQGVAWGARQRLLADTAP